MAKSSHNLLQEQEVLVGCNLDWEDMWERGRILSWNGQTSAGTVAGDRETVGDRI